MSMADNIIESDEYLDIIKDRKEELELSLKTLIHKSLTTSYNSKTSEEEFKRFDDLLNKTLISSFIFSENNIFEKCIEIRHTYFINIIKSIIEQRKIIEKKNINEQYNEEKYNENNEDNDIFAQRTLAMMYDQLSMATDNTGLLDESNIGIEDLNISHKDITEKSTKLKNELKLSNENKKIDAKKLFNALVFGFFVILFLFLYRILRRLFSLK